jgi:SAM-dependent methyltransferase
MSTLERSWNSLTPTRAAEYLRTYGHPAPGSRRILGELLARYARFRRISVLDLGCGNGGLYEYFKERKLRCTYTGVDFSEPLLEAARAAHAGDVDARFVRDDVEALTTVEPGFDFAIYSHVIEMLDSPEASLLRARELARRIAIRFFEPPEFDVDTVELLEMEVGDGRMVPYLRRKMSRDYYRLILSKLGCTRVDVYRDPTSKDQVHVLCY